MVRVTLHEVDAEGAREVSADCGLPATRNAHHDVESSLRGVHVPGRPLADEAHRLAGAATWAQALWGTGGLMNMIRILGAIPLAFGITALTSAPERAGESRPLPRGPRNRDPHLDIRDLRATGRASRFSLLRVLRRQRLRVQAERASVCRSLRSSRSVPRVRRIALSGLRD